MSGLEEPGNIAEYVRDTWGDANSCMSPDARATAVINDVNERLTAIGVPQVSWLFDSSLGQGAKLRKAEWSIYLGDEPYKMEIADFANVEQQAWQVSAVYHEARHAEQWFRMARERIGLGATVEQTTNQMVIPAWVVEWAALDPITQCDASQYESEEWYQSVYGSGAAHREATLSDTTANYAAYRALPEEADAWKVGDAVTQEYRNQSQ